jgi:hypothetical protein
VNYDELGDVLILVPVFFAIMKERALREQTLN